MLGTLLAAIGISFYIAGITIFRYFLPIFSVFLLISGIQLFLFGLMAEMLSKNYFETSANSSYNMSEVFKRGDY